MSIVLDSNGRAFTKSFGFIQDLVPTARMPESNGFISAVGFVVNFQEDECQETQQE